MQEKELKQMQEKKKVSKLSEKIESLEKTIEGIKMYLKLKKEQTKAEQEPFYVMPQGTFENIYHLAKYDVPKETYLKPLGLWFDKKYKKDMTERFLYQAHEESEMFYLRGDKDPLPILFRDLETDYSVDFQLDGIL